MLFIENWTEKFVKGNVMNLDYIPKVFKEKLNMDLYKKLVLFNCIDIKKSDEAKEFCLKNNVKYYGELLERYKERDLIKDEKDFFTMAFVAVTENIVYYDNQINNFMKDIKEKIEESSDRYEKLNLLFLYIEFCEMQKIVDNELVDELAETLMDSSLELSLEEYLIYLRYLLYSYNGNNNNDNNIFRVLEKIYQLMPSLKKDILNNLDIYYQLSKTYELLEEPKSKAFKVKGISQFIKTANNLLLKELNENENERLANQLNVKVEEIKILNYFLANKFQFANKVTGPGFNRLITAGVRPYVTEEKKIPLQVQYLIESHIDNKSKSKDLTIHWVLTSFLDKDIKCSKSFIKYVQEIPNLYWKTFYDKDKYLLEDGYFDILNEKTKKNLSSDLIISSEDLTKEEFNKIKLYVGNYNWYYVYYYEILYNNYNYLDLNNYKDENSNLMKDKLIDTLTAVRKLSKEKYKDFIVYLIDNLDKIPKRIHEKIFDLLTVMKKDENKDSETLKKLYECHIEYEYLNSPSTFVGLYMKLLNDECFTSIFNISEEDKIKALKDLLNSNLTDCHDKNRIREQCLTEKELEEIKINEKIEKIRTADSFFNLYWEMDYRKEFINNNKVLKVAYEKFKRFEKSFSDNAMKLVKLFVNNELMSKDELFNYFTEGGE
ncbi:MAG: hypothetical protein ACOCRK_02190 [bacterium]